MVLGHSNNIELSAVNIVLGGSTSGLTAMVIKWAKPRVIFHWELHRHHITRNTKVSVRRASVVNRQLNATRIGLK